MQVFEFKEMLIEIVISYPVGSDPVTLECCDLRSEMLFSIVKDESNDFVLYPLSKRIPLELIFIVAKIAEEEL